MISLDNTLGLLTEDHAMSVDAALRNATWPMTAGDLLLVIEDVAPENFNGIDFLKVAKLFAGDLIAP